MGQVSSFHSSAGSAAKLFEIRGTLERFRELDRDHGRGTTVDKMAAALSRTRYLIMRCLETFFRGVE